MNDLIEQSLQPKLTKANREIGSMSGHEHETYAIVDCLIKESDQRNINLAMNYQCIVEIDVDRLPLPDEPPA